MFGVQETRSGDHPQKPSQKKKAVQGSYAAAVWSSVCHARPRRHLLSCLACSAREAGWQLQAQKLPQKLPGASRSPGCWQALMFWKRQRPRAEAQKLKLQLPRSGSDESPPGVRKLARQLRLMHGERQALASRFEFAQAHVQH